MEIRVLQAEDLANASGLSRYVFDVSLRNRMEFEQSIPFVENYISEENMKRLYQEGKLMLWGAFDQTQLIAVGGLQSDGMITMLYVLPQCWGRKIGSQLLITMRQYAKEVMGLGSVSVNATPAWTSFYFSKHGFSFVNPNQNIRQPFVTLSASSEQVDFFKKEKITASTIACAVIGAVGFATIASILFMICYLQ